MGTSLHSAAGRGAGVRRALRDSDGVACSRQPCRAYRHRPPAGRDGNARGPARAVRCLQLLRKTGRLLPARCSRCLGRSGQRAPRSGRFASIMETGSAPRRWTGSMAILFGPETWCSMSALMSAIVLLRSAGSARGLSRSNRSAAMVRALRLLYGRDRRSTIEAMAVGREPGRARMLINVDNPTVSSFSSGLCRGRARRARLGNAALDQVRRDRGHHPGCSDREAWRSRIHQAGRGRVRSGGAAGIVAGGARAVVRVHHDPA